jgi:hypothetical protein
VIQKVEPYLSIVVCTRNDNHGGDLNQRTQIFLNGLAAQIERWCIPSELIIVEWNPPTDRQPVATEFIWPNTPWLEIKTIEVSPDLHRRYRHAEKIPLYQMIGKNVGIRRARGQFILATNIDLLFSNSLMRFISERRLEKNTFYRCDRVDVDRDVPFGSLDEQLEFCRTHVIRIGRKDMMWLVPKAARSRTINDVVRIVDEPDYRIRHNIDRHELWLRPLRKGISKLRSIGQFFDWSYKCLRDSRLVQYALPIPSMMGLLKLHFRNRRDLTLREWLSLILNYRRLPALHYFACGDFLLADRETWFRVKGSPEWDGYALYLDSLTLVTAYKCGMQFFDFPPEAVVYHMEHGGSWTPDQQQTIASRMQMLGVPVLKSLSYRLFVSKILSNRGFYLNTDNWGLVEESLPTTVISTGVFNDLETPGKSRVDPSPVSPVESIPEL